MRRFYYLILRAYSSFASCPYNVLSERMEFGPHVTLVVESLWFPAI